MNVFKLFSVLMLCAAMASCSNTEAIQQISEQERAAKALNTGGQHVMPALTDVRVQFDTPTGVPTEASGILQTKMKAQAQAHGLSLAKQGNFTLRLQGYFSIVTEERQSLIIYVWDVLDTDNNRLQRIQGQIPTEAADGNWKNVSPATLAVIAKNSVDQLKERIIRNQS